MNQPQQTIPCPTCQQPITFATNEPFCLNHLLFSQITVNHETGVECPACGSYFVLGIAAANVQYMLSPVQKPSGIVVPVLQFPKKLVGGN